MPDDGPRAGRPGDGQGADDGGGYDASVRGCRGRGAGDEDPHRRDEHAVSTRGQGRMSAALARLVPAADVVHIHGCSSKNVPVVLAARAAGRPVVLSLHTAGHDEPDAVKQSGRLRWWAYRSVDRYLSVSLSLVDALSVRGPARRADRLQVPNGIDTARFAPADRSRACGVPSGHLACRSTGR